VRPPAKGQPTEAWGIPGTPIYRFAAKNGGIEPQNRVATPYGTQATFNNGLVVHFGRKGSEISSDLAKAGLRNAKNIATTQAELNAPGPPSLLDRANNALAEAGKFGTETAEGVGKGIDTLVRNTNNFLGEHSPAYQQRQRDIASGKLKLAPHMDNPNPYQDFVNNPAGVIAGSAGKMVVGTALSPLTVIPAAQGLGDRSVPVLDRLGNVKSLVPFGQQFEDLGQEGAALATGHAKEAGKIAKKSATQFGENAVHDPVGTAAQGLMLGAPILHGILSRGMPVGAEVSPAELEAASRAKASKPARAGMQPKGNVYNPPTKPVLPPLPGLTPRPAARTSAVPAINVHEPSAELHNSLTNQGFAASKPDAEGMVTYTRGNSATAPKIPPAIPPQTMETAGETAPITDKSQINHSSVTKPAPITDAPVAAKPVVTPPAVKPEPPKAKAEYAGSVNLSKLSSTDLQDAYRARATRLGYDTQEPLTRQDVRTQARSLGLTAPALAKLPLTDSASNPRAWRPNNVHMAVWMDAVRDADDAAHIAQSKALRAYRADGTPENRAAFDAAVKLADTTFQHRSLLSREWGQSGQVLKSPSDPFIAAKEGDLFKEQTAPVVKKGLRRIPIEEQVKNPNFGKSNIRYTSSDTDEALARIQTRFQKTSKLDMTDCKS
jgi:hypothetical protein